MPVDDDINQAVARMVPDQLALAASAATEIMPKTESGDDLLQSLPSLPSGPEHNFFGYPPVNDETMLVDPQLQRNIHTEQQHHDVQSQMPLSQPMPLQQRSVPANTNLPHAQFLHDFRLNGDPHKSKTRGRFNAVRRKEVQEVRRQGACIRCRMLKKPVSFHVSTIMRDRASDQHSAPAVHPAPPANMSNLHGSGSHLACELGLQTSSISTPRVSTQS